MVQQASHTVGVEGVSNGRALEVLNGPSLRLARGRLLQQPGCVARLVPHEDLALFGDQGPEVTMYASFYV